MTSTLIEGRLQLVDDGRQTVPVGRTSVLVVDDHRTFAELLARALDAESDLECVGHARTRARPWTPSSGCDRTWC